MRVHAARGLRFRLTASYALFFTMLISVSSILFRQFLSSSLDQQVHETLTEEWGALKGYLRIERGHDIWYVDPHEPDEAGIKARLRRYYLLADSSGTIMDESPEMRLLGIDSPQQIRAAFASPQQWIEKKDSKGVPYLIRAGLIFDEANDQASPQRYYVAIGRPLTDNIRLLRNFTWLSAGLIPLIICAGSIAGWVLAGYGLSPVLQVAKTAQRISGSNLSLRIPPRGSGDELDFLIETFNQMIERLETSFVQVRQFSTDVSHELRTPLTILRGQLEVALMTAKTKEQYQDAIVDSLQDIERLSHIVRALLALSQAETGQVLLSKTRFDLSELIGELGEQFQIPAEGAGLILTVLGPASCEVELDRIQIERMLSNLLSNAIKFTPAGGTVNVEWACNAENALLTVRDTGRGILPAHLPHIFDRFYRVSEAEAAASPEKGLGLGLSFVAWIVKAHQGTITVESEPGSGTAFTVTLPAALPENLTGMSKV
ncbi:MAG: ATP-binding protein [Acidobacteriota bacterium]|nr:ATP-binding protein [Acidobacteriota bacterium]